MTDERNFLSIRHRGKGIPYGGLGEARPDGDANYGFRCAKGRPEVLDWIPELKRDPALDALVRNINRDDTGLLSIGCVSGKVADEKGFRYSGYVEFAFNSRQAIADAANYFPVFFHFDRCLQEHGFAEQAIFNWVLEGATFLEADRASGFTCTVVINTAYAADSGIADASWATCLEWLGHYLSSVPSQGEDTLYSLPVATA